jgi:hypothetical protein
VPETGGDLDLGSAPERRQVNPVLDVDLAVVRVVDQEERRIHGLREMIVSDLGPRESKSFREALSREENRLLRDSERGRYPGQIGSEIRGRSDVDQSFERGAVSNGERRRCRAGRVGHGAVKWTEGTPGVENRLRHLHE